MSFSDNEKEAVLFLLESEKMVSDEILQHLENKKKIFANRFDLFTMLQELEAAGEIKSFGSCKCRLNGKWTWSILWGLPDKQY